MPLLQNMRRHLVALLLSLLLLALPAFPIVAAGLATTAPAVLYDSHSLEADKLFVLTAGHPLHQIAVVDGWRKVVTYDDKTGWVRESLVRSWSGAVTTKNNVAVHAKPANQSSTVFYAQKGVLLEMLDIKGAWVEVLHRDGETGYVLINQVWLNNPQ